jgi:protein-S-isoprenylcysteine O-methyltransferase Ste14
VQLVLAVVVVFVANHAPAPTGARTARVVLAVALGLSAAVVVLWSSGVLGRALTVFPRPRPGAPLTRRGPYRLVRHPIYTALLMAAVAVVIVGSPFALIQAALLAFVLDRKASAEEAWLTEARPEYGAYREAVRWRFFPGIR